MMLFACTDNLIIDEQGNGSSGKGEGLGEIVLFNAGRANNQLSTRADGDGGSGSSYSETPGEIYYMEHASRFVCRMYYIADNASETEFDLTDNTKTISWFVVDGNVGNSLYWNKYYNNVVLSPADKSDESKYDSYGNDKGATFFYWQNRKNHAFLAWTDLNKAKNTGFKYGNRQGDLKLEPADMTYEERTGDKIEQSVLSGFKISGIDSRFEKIDESFANYIKNNYATISANSDLQTELASVSAAQAYDPNRSSWYEAPVNNVRFSYFLGARHDETYAAGEPQDDDHLTSYWRGPLLLWVWGDGQEQPYTLQDGDVVDEENPTAEGDHWVKDAGGNKVALRKKVYVDEGTADAESETIPAPTDEDPDNTITKYYIYKYLATFASGKFHYDFSQEPQYSVVIHKYYEVKEAEIINEFRANKFDLTRKPAMSSIADQPDPCLALTIMKPMGATQASNRVDLVFKHQFSQVQVNLKSSNDNSVSIEESQIKKVELLGVSEEGYVFTELCKKTEDDEDVFYVHPATYKDVDVSKIDEKILETNPYGTSLELFDMGADNYATGYLKSFNGITFGLLKAIRITWTETADNGGGDHVATFKVTDTNLNTLKSGRKYIWNIEIRRGTLAVITTTIDDWIVPTDTSDNTDNDNNLNYGADGTIKD